MATVGRNDACPCGSGKRAKHCCYRLDSPSKPESAAAGTGTFRATPSESRARNDAQALYRAGAAFAAQGRLDEAVDRLTQAIALRPEFAEAHLTLAQAYWSQGKADGAVECIQRGLALRPQFAEG